MIRTTLAGGILFLLPIVVLVIVLGKAIGIARQIVQPLASHLPVKSLIGLETPVILAIALVVLFCFFAGVLARLAIARRAVAWVETSLLSNLPGYEFIKSLSGGLLAAEDHQGYPVVLVRMEDAWQMAYLIERLEAEHMAVFIPGVPNPQSGSVYFVSADRVRIVKVPPVAALKCLKRYGLGAKALLGESVAVAAGDGVR